MTRDVADLVWENPFAMVERVLLVWESPSAMVEQAPLCTIAVVKKALLHSFC